MTERLRLQPMRPEDAENVIRILRHDLVKMTYMVPDLDREGAYKLFLRLKELSENDAHYVCGIYLENRLIGWLNDTEIGDSCVELGWVIDPQFHNHGYATEAVKAAIMDLHEKGFRSVTAGAFAENAASIRVMEKAGMQRLEQQDQIDYRGKSHSCIYYESQSE